jgi:predicted DsbA family dithiol-disulfide isomerase
VRTDRLQREYGVELRWTVFPLHPETPEEGMELAELFPVGEEQLRAMRERVQRVAAAEGLPLGARSRTYNSRGAQELGKWAETQGAGDAFRREVFRAYFVEGRNLALADELVPIAEAVGLPGKEAREVLAAGSLAGAVDADWRRARELGITAVPTHLCGGSKLVGFTAYEDFVRLIERE